jgi:hypothetical protein
MMLPYLVMINSQKDKKLKNHGESFVDFIIPFGNAPIPLIFPVRLLSRPVFPLFLSSETILLYCGLSTSSNNNIFRSAIIRLVSGNSY